MANNTEWCEYWLNKMRDDDTLTEKVETVIDYKHIQNEYKLKSNYLNDQFGIVIGITKEVNFEDGEDSEARKMITSMIHYCEQLKIMIDDINSHNKDGVINYVAIMANHTYLPCAFSDDDDKREALETMIKRNINSKKLERRKSICKDF
jgi:hypothetical protein